MAKHEAKKRRVDSSKVFTAAAVIAGFVLAEQSLMLMAYAIYRGYAATAAWLTGATVMAQGVIAGALAGYQSLCKSDHSEGGITFEAAKANGFSAAEESTVSPQI